MAERLQTAFIRQREALIDASFRTFRRARGNGSAPRGAPGEGRPFQEPAEKEREPASLKTAEPRGFHRASSQAGSQGPLGWGSK